MLAILKIAEKAKNLIIIGCSMRQEDIFLWLVLTCFLNKHCKRLIILDPSSEDIWERISNYWVGNICRYADVVKIPFGIEDGIKTLISAIDSKPE